MRVAFMGSDPIALPLLRFLQEAGSTGLHLQTVYTQPDRRTGRGMHLQANAIKEWAREHQIEVRQPVKCGVEEADYFRGNGIDLVLVMAYGQILPRGLLESVPLGFLNFHASLLPRLRGASPIHTAIALGLPQSGVTLMRIIPKLDAGPVADAEPVTIGPADTTADLHAKLAMACVPLLERSLPGLLAGRVAFRDQDEGCVTYCRIIEKSDAHLDFTRPADELLNRIRAFQPWPGTAFPFEGIDIRVWQAETLAGPSESFPSGTFLTDPDGFARIICEKGSLRLLRLQRPGGKPLPTDAFLRGFPIANGTLLESREMSALEAPRPFPYKRK